MSEMKFIAHIENDFSEKFGIPRQSGLAEVKSRIIFEKEYRDPEAFRGLEGFSHIWILWQFSEALRGKWSPTVRPPRLGGNKRMGVFATRSPFRPNPIGLSSVKLERIELNTPQGPILYVSGADILNGTPIYDIKPYLAYTDSHPDAAEGFAAPEKQLLEVVFPEEFLKLIPEEKRTGLIQILAEDMRPQYQNSPDRIYNISFGGFDIGFNVKGDTLTVTSIKSLDRA